MFTTNTFYTGHVIDILAGWPAACVDALVSSPPYWNLRDYKVSPVTWMPPATGPWSPDRQVSHAGEHHWEEVAPKRRATPGDVPSANSIVARNRTPAENRPQKVSRFCTTCGAWQGNLGLEPDPDLFIEHLCQVMDAAYRVLPSWGVAWINLGDTYGGSGGAGGDWQHGSRALEPKWKQASNNGVPDKGLAGIPWRFERAIEQRGWIVRDIIPWVKPDPMPSSVTDRCTPCWEPVFMLVKQERPRYWVNEQTLVVQWDTPPKDGMEGTDWDWIECPTCHGTLVQGKDKCKRCNGVGEDAFGFFCKLCNGQGFTGEPITCKRCKKSERVGAVKYNYWFSRDYHHALQFEPLKHPEHLGKKRNVHAPKQQAGLGKENRDDVDYAMPVLVTEPDESRVFGGNKAAGYERGTYSGNPYIPNPLGRQMRNVIFTASANFKGAHFAVFPPKLVKPLVEMSVPRTVCTRCGLPETRVIIVHGRLNRSWHDHSNDAVEGAGQGSQERAENWTKGRYWREITSARCTCDAPRRAGIGFDPFSGSGTLAKVLHDSGRDFVGTDAAERYNKMAEKRVWGKGAVNKHTDAIRKTSRLEGYI